MRAALLLFALFGMISNGEVGDQLGLRYFQCKTITPYSLWAGKYIYIGRHHSPPQPFEGYILRFEDNQFNNPDLLYKAEVKIKPLGSTNFYFKTYGDDPHKDAYHEWTLDYAKDKQIVKRTHISDTFGIISEEDIECMRFK